MNPPDTDLMAFLHALENVFDHYCEQLAEAQGAVVLAACREAALLPAALEWD